MGKPSFTFLEIIDEILNEDHHYVLQTDHGHRWENLPYCLQNTVPRRGGHFNL